MNVIFNRSLTAPAYNTANHGFETSIHILPIIYMIFGTKGSNDPLTGWAGRLY